MRHTWPSLLAQQCPKSCCPCTQCCFHTYGQHQVHRLQEKADFLRLVDCSQAQHSPWPRFLASSREGAPYFQGRVREVQTCPESSSEGQAPALKACVISPCIGQTLRLPEAPGSGTECLPSGKVQQCIASAASLVCAWAQSGRLIRLRCTSMWHARQSPTSAPLAPSEMALPTSPGGPPSLVSPSLGMLPVDTDGSALLMASCTSAHAAPAAGARAQMLRHEAVQSDRPLICTAL